MTVIWQCVVRVDVSATIPTGHVDLDDLVAALQEVTSAVKELRSAGVTEVDVQCLNENRPFLSLSVAGSRTSRGNSSKPS